MEMIRKMGMLFLFLVSNFGYWEFFRRKAQINVFFLPAFTVSLQVTVLFAGGLLNCLKPAVVLLFGVGLLLALRFLVRDFKNAVIPYLNIGYLFLIAGLLAVLVATKGQVFTHYDNFSHWAMVVKTMLATNRYPNFSDSVIMFQEYPLGSASYIYYFAKVVSGSECIQMTAQAFMMLCFLLPVFKCVKKNRIISGIFVVVFANFILCYNIDVRNLLVDTLLPLQGMAALFFVYSQCCGLDRPEKRGTVSVLYAIPFLCTVVQIKNSGIFFAALAFAVIFASLRYERRDILAKAAAIIAPLLSLYLWHTHCSYVFDNASVSKHAMTVENYTGNFSVKSDETIRSIMLQMLKFSVTGRDLYLLLAFLAVGAVLCFILAPVLKKQYLKMLGISAVMYVLYMVGVFFMYLFSMPEQEALTLAGISRYVKTVFIAVYYLLLVLALAMISSMKAAKKKWICIAVLFVMLLFNWRDEEGSFATVFARSTSARRDWMEQTIADYQVEPGSSYMILTSGDSGYWHFMCRYLLNSADVSARVITDASQLEDVQDYDYLFLYDTKNKIIRKWVKQNYPEQAGNKVIRTEEE